VLKQGQDFDKPAGQGSKFCLLKAGAELLAQVFNLAAGAPVLLNAIENYEEGLFSFTVSMPISKRDTGEIVSYGLGNANSNEIKYRYRWQDVKDGDEISDDAVTKEDHGKTRVRIDNPDTADQVNTLLKMANKRAYVDGILRATGASRLFTQDLEDLGITSEPKATQKQIDLILNLADGDEQKVKLVVKGMFKIDIAGMKDITISQAKKVIDHLKSGGKPITQHDAPPHTQKDSPIDATVTEIDGVPIGEPPPAQQDGPGAPPPQSGATVRIFQRDGVVGVQAPRNEPFRLWARDNRGKWNTEKYRWDFPDEMGQDVVDAVHRFFPDADCDYDDKT
jgi:hypothetical protein